MKHSDKLIIETLEKKNDLESYIYNMRSYLGDQYKDFIEPEKINAFLNQLYVNYIIRQTEESWLYSEGDKAAKSEFIKRVNVLKQ